MEYAIKNEQRDLIFIEVVANVCVSTIYRLPVDVIATCKDNGNLIDFVIDLNRNREDSTEAIKIYREYRIVNNTTINGKRNFDFTIIVDKEWDNKVNLKNIELSIVRRVMSRLYPKVKYRQYYHRKRKREKSASNG